MFVALFYGQDGALGRTILCENWDQAVTQCIQLAIGNGEAMTNEEVVALSENGEFRFWLGCPCG